MKVNPCKAREHPRRVRTDDVPPEEGEPPLHPGRRNPPSGTSNGCGRRLQRPDLSGSGIGTQALQEKGAECPFLPSCDRSCPNARTRARIARAIVTVGLGVMVIPVRVATSVPLGGT